MGRCGVRVSSEHLCEAEAPTEPTGETSVPYTIKLEQSYRRILLFLS